MLADMMHKFVQTCEFVSINHNYVHIISLFANNVLLLAIRTL